MKQNLRVRLLRRLLVCLSMVFGPGLMSDAWGQTSLLTDDFNAITPPYTLTAQGWTAHNAGGTNPIVSSSPNLTLVGLVTSGGSASLNISGEDLNKPFSSTVNSGSVYASMLINVSAVGSTGDYFFHIAPASVSTAAFYGRLSAKSATGGYSLGVSKLNDASPTYSSQVLLFNTTYLVIIKYAFITGANTNDQVSLFINPGLNTSEPISTTVTSSTLADATSFGVAVLRQGSNATANSVSLRMDYIRVGTTWESVSSSNIPTPTLTANPTSLTGLTYVAGNGPATTPISVSGTNFTAVSGSVTVASSNTAFVVSPTSTAFNSSSLAATTFSVSLVSGLPVSSTYTGNITFEGGGATTVVPVSGTVTATAPLPNLSINDITVAEGNAGATIFSFSVTLSAPAPAGGVTFDIATQDGTATTVNNDYVARNLTSQTIPAGASSYTFDVTVNGDATSEPNETFFVNITNVTGANVVDGQGFGTITNDDAAPPTYIHTIQGLSHISSLSGQFVSNVPGIVTALRSNGFYMQDPNPDADERTSEGIFVFTNSSPTVSIGMSVQVAGTVAEFRSGGSGGTNNLTTTQISGPTITTLSSGNTLAAPIILGSGGRAIPTQFIEHQAGDVETSGLTFDPASDGIDFYESLEGMRVAINNPVTVSPTLDASTIWVVADNGANTTGRNARGGITISANDFNPERILIYTGGGGSFPPFSLTGINVNAPVSSLTGIVDYFGGDYEVLPTSTLSITASSLTREVTALAPTTNQLTIATFNVENLSPSDLTAKFNNLASRIVTNLQSPDIINLEEIQDNTGVTGGTGNSTVDATTTYQNLINAISTAGGPAYQYRQIDPVANQDGGAPGGNIRVAFLFNPARVTFIDRAGGSSTAAVSLNTVGGLPQLSFSPGRIDPTNTAFNNSRKPLVGEFLFNGKKIFVIANHFNSKGGDQDLFGKTQPPVLSSETQRNQQATIVRNFVSSLLTIDPNANIIVAGDLNDFQFSNPLTILKGSGATALTTLIETLPVVEQYTYNFGGNSQAIDHIMASPGLVAKLDAYDGVHINAEFFDQDSDHDPSVSRFNILPLSATLVTSTSAVCQGNPVTFTAIVASFGASYSYTITNGTNSTSATAQTSSSFVSTITPTVPGAFTLTVLAIDGSTTAMSSSSVTVNTPPSAPTYTLTNSGTVCAGTPLVVTANGCTSGTVNFTINPATPSGSVASPLYTFTGNTPPGTYTVCAICTVGSCSSPMAITTVTISSTAATLSASSPVICSGSNVTLTAGGGTNYHFTGPGGFNQNSTISTAVVSLSGTYSVTVTNANGCTAVASLSIGQTASGISLGSPAAGSTVCAGSSILVPVAASGAINAYQWYKNGVQVTGQTSATLSLFAIQPSDAGSYSLVAMGTCGSMTSTAFALDVTPQPTITLLFPGGTLTVGGSLPTIQLPIPGQVLVQASGGTSYNWVSIIDRINGYEVRKTADNTSGLFTIDKPGPYRVTVTGANGCTRTVEGLIVN